MVAWDSYELINRMFIDEDISTNITADSERDNNIISPISYAYGKSNYYTLLYNNMILCWKYSKQMEDSIKPEQFYRDKFIISIPVKQFQRVTKGSLMTIEFTWPSYTLNPFNVDPTSNDYMITQCLIIQHGKKAILFDNSIPTVVSNVTESFKVDLEHD